MWLILSMIAWPKSRQITPKLRQGAAYHVTVIFICQWTPLTKMFPFRFQGSCQRHFFFCLSVFLLSMAASFQQLATCLLGDIWSSAKDLTYCSWDLARGKMSTVYHFFVNKLRTLKKVFGVCWEDCLPLKIHKLIGNLLKRESFWVHPYLVAVFELHKTPT